jgi:hypothetical protein
MKPKYYQNIYLHLSDGRVIKASIPAFLEEDETVLIIKVEFGKPKELPEGTYFGKIDD